MQKDSARAMGAQRHNCNGDKAAVSGKCFVCMQQQRRRLLLLLRAQVTQDDDDGKASEREREKQLTMRQLCDEVVLKWGKEVCINPIKKGGRSLRAKLANERNA